MDWVFPPLEVVRVLIRQMNLNWNSGTQWEGGTSPGLSTKQFDPIRSKLLLK